LTIQSLQRVLVVCYFARFFCGFSAGTATVHRKRRNVLRVLVNAIGLNQSAEWMV